ncbi:MAG: hypothetical protein JW741_02885, partial [Sedimentisphaerales bacterium]|nr:hypothetical protein [Sedimentisphaerales bacterium]
LWELVFKSRLQGNHTNDFLEEYKPNLHFAKPLFLQPHSDAPEKKQGCDMVVAALEKVILVEIVYRVLRRRR